MLALAEPGRKKELQSKYSEREIIGGVYLVRNTLNNKLLIEATTDMNGSKNRFDFAKQTGSCVYVKLQKDWDAQGSGDFVFEVLEELKKSDAQTGAAFKADVELLKEIWLEKFSNESHY